MHPDPDTLTAPHTETGLYLRNSCTPGLGLGLKFMHCPRGLQENWLLVPILNRSHDIDYSFPPGSVLTDGLSRSCTLLYTGAYLEYCTISTYSSPLVTCDHHKEMSISSAPEMRCDNMNISSPAEMWPEQPLRRMAGKIFVHLFSHRCDP